MVLTICLFSSDIPANMESLLEVIGQIAAFEIIPTEQIYESWFNVIDVEALTSYFEAIGIEHLLLFNNLGTLGVVIATLPLFYILYFITLWLSRFKFCFRRSKSLGKNLFWGAFLRIFIESYIIGFICILLNLQNLDYDESNNWTYFNAVMTLIFLPTFILFPIITGTVMCINFQ